MPCGSQLHLNQSSGTGSTTIRYVHTDPTGAVSETEDLPLRRYPHRHEDQLRRREAEVRGQKNGNDKLSSAKVNRLRAKEFALAYHDKQKPLRFEPDGEIWRVFRILFSFGIIGIVASLCTAVVGNDPRQYHDGREPGSNARA
jgi:hypothetical protein